MEKTERKSNWNQRKTRRRFILIAIFPIIAIIFTVGIIMYGEVKQIQDTYRISGQNIESPYIIFDKVRLLNSYTSYDFLDLQDRAMRNPDSFNDMEYIRKENEKLQNKYSFLVVMVSGKITYFGEPEQYKELYVEVSELNNTMASLTSMYHGRGEENFIIKKLGFSLSDGRIGNACIVTKTNVTLPHIRFFTIAVIVLIVVILAVVIIAIVGYNYYNIVVPIRYLQQGVVRIGEGKFEESLDTKKYEGEFTPLFEEFEQMRITLKESIEERNKADALTKEVIGNITHDLKTPLTAITGYAEGIMDGIAATPDRMDKYVRTIHAKSVDMAVLVDELSFFTKIYQKEESFHFVEVNVEKFFGESVGNMVLDLETRGIQLLYQCYVEEDETVVLDPDKIRRVIANIIGNAVKYIQNDYGIIRILITKAANEIIVMIKDNGKGIEKEELPRIFERFYRTDSSRNSKTGGSGLGLAIAKKIMEEHRGQIWAESELGKGTTIYFSFPQVQELEEGYDE